MPFTLDIPTILQNGGWAGKQWAVRDDMYDYTKLEWLDAAPKPTEQELLDAELAAAKAARIAKVKTEARERILANFPAWKQDNCALGGYDGLYDATKPVTGATNTSPIVISCAAHGYKTGDKVTVAGVGGNLAANVADNLITVVDADSFSLDGTTGDGEYTSGGTVKRQTPLGIRNDIKAIRAASDQAELDIDSLATVAAVQAFTW